MRRALLLLIVLVIGTSPAWAQFETGNVVGTIKDTSGAVVPGAKVTLTNTQTGVTNEKSSDANGSYEFITVRPGTYPDHGREGWLLDRARRQRAGHGRRTAARGSLDGGRPAQRKNTVSASAVLLQTDSSDRSQVITGEQTRALPLNGREYSALALLSPGVRLSALNTGGFTPREGSFNVNGLRSTFNNFLIDGVDNNAYGTSNQGFSNQVMQPAPDAVGEFKVVTNNMSAEYGRSAGATINVAYASGTNQFRGSAWEFMRRTEFNATGFFRPATGVKPGFDRDHNSKANCSRRMDPWPSWSGPVIRLGRKPTASVRARPPSKPAPSRSKFEQTRRTPEPHRSPPNSPSSRHSPSGSEVGTKN